MTRTITVDGITVELHRQTIRMRMQKTAIYAVLREISSDIIEEVGLGETTTLSALLDFVVISTRVIALEGDLDFEFLRPTDTEEMMKTKFSQFIDSQHLSLLDDVTIGIRTMDKVQDIALAPTPLPEDAEKKT